MACDLNTIKSDSLKAVRKIARGEKSVVSQFNKNGNLVITPSRDSKKVNNMGKAVAMANRIVNNINKWSKDKFNSDAYTGQWTNLVTTDNNVTIELNFPKSLERAYQKKIARDEAREVQMADAERAGVNLNEYSDDYLFDFSLASTPQGYKYGMYLDNKSKMLNYINAQIGILSERAGKTKKDFEQIAELKEVSRRLFKDIKALKTETAVLSNYFNYFHRDLDTIQEILFSNPTLDNLMSAREFINTMKFVHRIGQGDNFSDIYYEDIQDPEHRELFGNFVNRLNRMDNDLKKKELDFMEDGFDAILNNRDVPYNEQDEEANKLKEHVGKITTLSAQLLPIDGDSGASPLQLFVRRIYDDATGKKETYELREELKNHKKKLEAALKKRNQHNNRGILGALFSPVTYDMFKRKTSSGRHRIAGKFSDNWFSLEEVVAKKFKQVEGLVFKKNKDVQDYAKIKQRRREIFDRLNTEKVNFIDVRKIPELMNHPDLQGNFGNFFSDTATAEAYKEELIQSLIGESGNRAVAEKVYDEIVQAQLEKLFEFEINIDQYSKRLFKKHGVNDVSMLPESERNNLLAMYYTASPFAFAENYETSGTSSVKKVFYQNGVRKESIDQHTMEYVSYIPTQQKHFDQQFEQEIASDEDMYKGWELFDKAVKYINRNRNYSQDYNQDEFEDSLTNSLDMMQKHATGLWSLAKWFGKDRLDRFKAVLSTRKYRDLTNLKLHGSIRSLDETIDSKMKPILKVVVNAKMNPSNMLSKTSIPKDVVTYLENRLKTKLPATLNLNEFIREKIEQEVLDEQNLDLVDTLSDQLEIVEKFKAKKEIESKLLFAKNQIKRVDDNGESIESKHAINMITSFINRHLYEANNRANWSNFWNQSDYYFTKVYNTHEREIRRDIENAIKAIKELTANGTKAVKIQAERDIQELQSILDNQGRVITTGSVMEAALIKLNILVGLGLNLPSQMKNYAIGNLALRQNDGLEWTEGNGPKAVSYTRKWKIARRKLRPQERKAHRLTNTLINNLGIFQNSANEFDRIKESNYQNQLLKFVSNPLHIVGEMEKTIQRPQILAKLADIKIIGQNGQTVPVFDVNDFNNPHPAFDLDSEGNIRLKAEFDTPENRATWINRNSDEYAHLFGDSGVLPRLIARINGDYRETSTTAIKETSVGSWAMMFKTWLPAFIMRRYGKKDGVIRHLVESGRTQEAFIPNALTMSMYAGIGASVFFSPLVAVGIGASILGGAKLKQLIASDANTLSEIFKEIHKGLYGLKFATNTIRYAGGTVAKNVQQSTDLIFGKRIIPNKFIDDVIGIEQKGETDTEFEKTKARVQFLMTEASTTLTLLMLKLLANAILFPDEDERDEYNKAETDWEKISKQSDVAAYFFLENMLTGLADDTNLMNDPVSFAGNVVSGTMSSTYDKWSGFMGSFGKQLQEGDYERGKYAGQNRVAVNAKKMFIPKGANLTLGIMRTSEMDYRPQDPINKEFQTDWMYYEKERMKQRGDRKRELQERYKKIYKYKSEEQIESKVQKALREEFPTLTKYFNEKGELKPYYKNKVKKYE